MQVTLLKSKIHRARVTDADLHYEGSLTIDRSLMDAVGLVPYERVDVVNINNGARFSTYVIEGPAGGGDICLNGAAARLGQRGDLVIIMSYAELDGAEAVSHRPRIMLVDEHNRPVRP